MTADPVLWLHGPKLAAALERHGFTLDQVARRMCAGNTRDPVDSAGLLAQALREGSCPISQAFLAALVVEGLRPTGGLADDLTTL